ncbi:MAG TPA: radical SAM protein, partial [Bacteroidales bacterium]|nr:radical SAM protein [Bacteroidales bacterium]
FIGDAKEESINMILQFAEARKTGAIDRLVVTGCLSQRYMNELKLEIPEVDAWYGVNDDKKIIEENGANYRTELLGERHLSTPKHFAYLKIAEGCNRSCSFCAIPMIRGAHKSRSMESLIEEAKKLATLGVKELLLISQDLTWYGIDLYKEQKLTELVRSLSDLNLFSRIRLHYLYPHTFPTDLLDLMSQRSDICPYLD